MFTLDTGGVYRCKDASHNHKHEWTRRIHTEWKLITFIYQASKKNKNKTKLSRRCRSRSLYVRRELDEQCIREKTTRQNTGTLPAQSEGWDRVQRTLAVPSHSDTLFDAAFIRSSCTQDGEEDENNSLGQCLTLRWSVVIHRGHTWWTWQHCHP